MTSDAQSDRNDPVSALAIRLLVSAGACSQQDANTAFHAACSMLEEEAARQNVTLPWVVRKLTPLSEEALAARNPYAHSKNHRSVWAAGFRAAEAVYGIKP